MKRLKLPQLAENMGLPEKISKKEFEEMLEENMNKFEPAFFFDVDHFWAEGTIDYCNEGNRVYAYICPDNNIYYDYAVVKTDDFYFETYAQYKKAVRAMAKQLCARWKEWVEGLYKEKK